MMMLFSYDSLTVKVAGSCVENWIQSLLLSWDSFKMWSKPL